MPAAVRAKLTLPSVLKVPCKNIALSCAASAHPMVPGVSSWLAISRPRFLISLALITSKPLTPRLAKFEAMPNTPTVSATFKIFEKFSKQFSNCSF